MATLRAGLVGLGMMGRHHARVLGSLDGVRLVGVADPNGNAHGVAETGELLDSVERLIELGLDYCVVAVPTFMHEQVALSLAEANVHALIEKPIAPDIPSAERIAKAFAGRGLVGAVGHIERYNPALQQARSRLADGQLGEIYQIITRRQGPFPERIADVGVVKDLATHDIDLTGWVTQQSYVSVAAHTANKSGRSHEDLIAIVGQLSEGTVVNHLVNWLSPLKERMTIMTGERGTFVADTLSADLTFYENGRAYETWEDLALFRGVSEGDMVRYAFPKPEPLRTEHEAFRDAVLGVAADIVTLEEGLETVRVAEACLSSARQGHTITL